MNAYGRCRQDSQPDPVADRIFTNIKGIHTYILSNNSLDNWKGIKRTVYVHPLSGLTFSFHNN